MKICDMEPIYKIFSHTSRFYREWFGTIEDIVDYIKVEKWDGDVDKKNCIEILEENFDLDAEQINP